MAKAVDPYNVVRRLRGWTSQVAVAFSCGKDSAAVLELCRVWFDRVAVFHMYHVPGLSFHERYLAYWTERMGAKLHGGEILRLPHWSLAKDLQAAVLRPDCLSSENVPTLSIRDVEVYVAKQTGIDWFAHGMKKADSLERRAMLNKESGIMLISHRAFPIADWSNRAVSQYLRNNGIPLSPEYEVFGRSYEGGIRGDVIPLLKKHYPEDYAKLLKRFPFAEAMVMRASMIDRPVKARKEA